MSYEFEQAKTKLAQIKISMIEYLSTTCSSDEKARTTFQYLEAIVSKIIKRQAYQLCFESNGSPLWHGEIMTFLANWILAENELGIIMEQLIGDELI